MLRPWPSIGPSWGKRHQLTSRISVGGTLGYSVTENAELLRREPKGSDGLLEWINLIPVNLWITLFII